MPPLRTLQVHFDKDLAGILRREEDGQTVFEYEASYLEGERAPISQTMPRRAAPYRYESGLPPFFDNLVAEGWLKNAQTQYLGTRPNDRFSLLSHFGYDCSGAVWVEPSEAVPQKEFAPEVPDTVLEPEAWLAAASGRASLSGVQPKLLVRKAGRSFFPVTQNELSTHIAKLSSHDSKHQDIVEIEYLTSEAARVLLRPDSVARMQIAPIKIRNKSETVERKALIIERFDRRNDRRLHFEEFNQLFGYTSQQKYDGSYEAMCKYLRQGTNTLPDEADTLVRRILACILLGNTDAHLKNFALFNTGRTMRLTPSYDMVAASLYPEYSTLALSIDGAEDLRLRNVSAKHIVHFSQAVGTTEQTLRLIIEEFRGRLDDVSERIAQTTDIHQSLRNNLTRIVEKRWNGTFDSIGSYLSKKHDTDAKP